MLNRRNFMKMCGAVAAAPLVLLKGKPAIEATGPTLQDCKDKLDNHSSIYRELKPYYRWKVPIGDCCCLAGDVVLLKTDLDFAEGYVFPKTTKARVISVLHTHDSDHIEITAIDCNADAFPVQLFIIDMRSEFSITYNRRYKAWWGPGTAYRGEGA